MIRPWSVNLMALLTRFSSTWRRRCGSPTSRSGVSAGHLPSQLQVLLVGAERHGLQAFGQAAAEFKRDLLQRQLAGFDLGQVQDVVQQAQQGIAGFQHHLQVFPLLRVRVRYPARTRSCR